MRKLVIYIGEASRHFQTRMTEHIRKDKNSHVYKHIHNSEECFTKYTTDCFSILDTATSKFQLKLKEGLYIGWKNPELNKQVNHLVSTLSVYIIYICIFISLFIVFVFFVSYIQYVYFVSIFLHWFMSTLRIF